MSVIRFVRPNPGYTLMFMLGVLTSLPYTATEIHQALEVVGILMLVALFASLRVPFAAFCLPESRLKWVLQNAPLATFGAYAMEVIKEPSLVKAVLMVCAMGMHISYWSSGIHSRQYRLDQFKLGFAATMPQTCRILAVLNGTGRSHLADELVQIVLAQADRVTTTGKLNAWALQVEDLGHLSAAVKPEVFQASADSVVVR